MKYGGIIYGGIQGILLVYTILAAMFLLAPVINEMYTNAITGSILGDFMYSNNILLGLFIR